MRNVLAYTKSNIYKTWLLLTGFFIFVIGVGWLFSYIFETRAILIIAVGISFLMSFISYWYSDKIVLAMSRAKQVKEDQAPVLYKIVKELCQKAKIPMPKIYIIDEQAPNAFATGRNPKNSAVAVTVGLLNILDQDELKGVIAHELSHIKNKDILLQTIVVVLVGSIVLLSDFLLRWTIWGGGGRRREQNGGQFQAILLVIGILAAILTPIIAKLIQLAISRKREFLADASGALLGRCPEELAKALEKISKSTTPLRVANKATAHLYITNPLKENQTKGLAKLFMTHPPVEERVRRLKAIKI